MFPQPQDPQGQQPLSEEEVIRQFEPQLKELVDRNCRQAVDKEKVIQYAIIRRNDFYYRGNQNLVPTMTGTGEVVDYKPVNGNMLMATGSNKQKAPVYDYVINNFRGDLRKFVGVLGQKSPNVKAQPAWQSDEAGIKRSQIADDVASYLRSQWDVDGANRYLVLSLGKNGTTFFRTSYVTDAARYGEREEPVWGTELQKVEPDSLVCPQCGTPNPANAIAMGCSQCFGPLGPENLVEGRTEEVPVVTGTKKFARGAAELSMHSAYEVTTPFYIKDTNLLDCPWLWLDLERDAGACVLRHPKRGLEDMLRQGGISSGIGSGIGRDSSSSSELGMLARNQAQSPSGYEMYDRPNRWRVSEFWLRPTMYPYLIRSEDSAEGVLDTLQRQYPTGIKLTWVNGKLVQVEAERIDEVWTAVKPETSEYLYADPLFNDYIQGADLMNDGLNIIAQLMETGIPAIIHDPNVLKSDKIRNGWQVNEFIPCVPGMGAQMDKAFYKIPTSTLDPRLYEIVSIIHNTLRENVGLLPAIWGGDENTNTAEQSRRRLNQALMILATTWNEMRKGWARAYRNGARQLAKYSLGTLVNSQGDAESVTTREVQDIKEILSGGWEFECDQAIPMSWTQLRDFVTEVFASGNQLMVQFFGMQDPANMDKVQEGIGIPGWKLPGRDERNRIRDLIGRLLKGQPVMTPIGPMPSIPLDFKITWNPKMLADVVHEWLMGEEGRSQEGTPGYDNVMAAGMSAIDAMAPPPMPDQQAPDGEASPAPAATPGSDQLPGPLESAQPPQAPEAPLQQEAGPPGSLKFNTQPMVQ